MASTTFASGTVIPSTWLNDVNGVVWVLFGGVTTAALGRTALGLGTISTQAANNVAITGGTIAGATITGGTVSSTALSGSTITSTPISGSTGSFTTLAASSTLTPAALVDISGASAGQIKFPSTANLSADANTLDDYKEGSFTPTISFGGGSTGVTYSVQQGFYVKLGAIAIIRINLVLTAKGSSTGNAAIGSLPFLGDVLSAGPIIWSNTTTAYVSMMAVGGGANDLSIYGATAATTSFAQITHAGIANNTSLQVTVMMRV